MNLAEALRVTRESRISIVGAGGKSTALFLLGEQIQPPVILTSSTHFSLEQVESCRHHVVFPKDNLDQTLDELISATHPTLITSGVTIADKVTGLNFPELTELMNYSKKRSIPMVIEADGSRKKPLKAPGTHEPAIPEWSTDVVVVVGLSAIGQPCNESVVHRPEIFRIITGLFEGEIICPEHIAKSLIHPEGGLKNIPVGARKIALINQCDDIVRQTNAGCVYKKIREVFDVVLTTSLINTNKPIIARMEPTACIILAAGDSTRFGSPKALAVFDGETFIHRAIKAAQLVGAEKIIVISGEHDEKIREDVSQFDIEVARNPLWRDGQGTSVACGIKALRKYYGSVIFMLVDQPHLPPLLLSSLIEKKAASDSQIAMPDFQERRGNPVLFDRSLFPELSVLSGEEGGRAIINKHRRITISWLTDAPITDIDTTDDLANLLERN